MLLLASPPLAPVAAQTGTVSTVSVPDLFFSGQALQREAPANASACGPAVGPGGGTGAAVAFTYAPAISNYTFYQNSDIDVTVAFTAPPAPGGAPIPPTTGSFTLEVGLGFPGNKTTKTAPVTSPAPGTPPAPVTIKFEKPAAGNASAGNGTKFHQGGGKLEVSVAFTGASPGLNIQMECGSRSKVGAFLVALGTFVGDPDADQDGIPDSLDDDDDNDSESDRNEMLLSRNCTGPAGGPFDFQHERARKPGDHDGDGYSDVDECAKGSHPLRQSSVPPQAPQPPWGLIILGAILLVAAILLVLFFTVLGKAVKVTVLSSPAVIIAPGAQATFQAQVTNLRKKGNPVNFQLAAANIPEGWDARVQPDHVTLDPQSGNHPSETVTLTVEAPERTDPESAVVRVKAVALNAAGKKDTLKVPHSAKTITSINVPPNAKVPVKRGSPVKLVSEKGAATAASAPTAPAAAVAAAEAVPMAAEKTKKGKRAKEEPTSEPETPPPPAAAPAAAPAAVPAPAAAKPSIQVGGLTHKPLSFKQGEEVKSSVTVTNNGPSPQTLKLSLFVNDGLADAQSVSVKPGKSKDVTFKWVAQERNRLNIRGELVQA